MNQMLLASCVTSLALLGLCSCGSFTDSNTSGNTGTAAANSKTTGAAPARKAEITTTAEALVKEYKSSKSTSKWDGKVVEISGRFELSGGTVDAPEVKFETGDTAVQVTCRINPSALQAAAKFEKGQEIKMTGIGELSIIGPLFKDCQIAP